MNFERVYSLHNHFGMKKLPTIRVGQFLEVHEEMKDGDNKRIWKFSGLVISVKNSQSHTGTFTMRGESSGVVLEKTYPLCFDKFVKIIELNRFKVKRSKLYYMRDKIGKDARLTSLVHQNDRGNVIYLAS
ncbi:MAG: 50S ribosomal protein L19 [Candidatus Absconditabacterales bacterium]|nr:50S ribosomal protein L19 [Candidatus Absconditabacterales bacterium]